jgi:hypothetical protein
MLTVTLTDQSEARVKPFRRLGVELYAVGIYWAGTLIDHSTHMSEQGCIQWAYHWSHQSKKQALTNGSDLK